MSHTISMENIQKISESVDPTLIEPYIENFHSNISSFVALSKFSQILAVNQNGQIFKITDDLEMLEF